MIERCGAIVFEQSSSFSCPMAIALSVSLPHSHGSGIDVGHLPFVPCSSFLDKMIGDTLGFLLQHRVRDGSIGQH